MRNHKGGERVQIVNPGISPETFPPLSSPSPGGMARQRGEEGCFLSALLSQWAATSSQPMGTEVLAEAALRADLEQEGSSHRQSEGGLRSVAGALAMPAPEIVGWAVAEPAQGEFPDEPPTGEEPKTTCEALSAMVTSGLPLAEPAAGVLPPTREALEAASGPVDAVEPLAMAHAARQPQAAIWPQAEQPGELRAAARGVPEAAPAGAWATPQLQGQAAQAMTRQPDIGLLWPGGDGQAQGQTSAAAQPGSQVALEPSAVTAVRGPATASQGSQGGRLAAEVLARPLAEGMAPLSVLARSTRPPRAPSSVSIYQPVTGGGPRAEAGPRLWPPEEPTTGQHAVPQPSLASRTSSPPDRLMEGRRAGGTSVSGQSWLELGAESPPAAMREAVPVLPWDDQHLPGQPMAGQLHSEAAALSKGLHPSDTEARGGAGGLEVRPQGLAGPANPEAVIAGAEADLPHLVSQPVPSRTSSEKDAMPAEPLVVSPWRQEERALSQEDSRNVEGEGSVASPAQRITRDSRTARGEAALEAVEASSWRARFPAERAVPGPQAGPERQMAFAKEPMPSELSPHREGLASAMPPSDEARAMAAKELWQQTAQSRSAESSVIPLAQEPAADVAWGLPGSVGAPSAAGAANSGEEVSSDSDSAISLVVRELVARVYVSLQRGEPEWRLQLRPHHLGHLEIRLSTGAHGVTLRIRAETPEAQALIQAHLDQLRSGLAERGVSLERCEVVIGQPDAEGSALAGHPGGWGGMPSRSYEALEPELPRRMRAPRPRAESTGEARRVSTNRVSSFIDLQA